MTNRVDSFHVGQVWRSPRGQVYLVVDVRRGGQAILRAGAMGEGRKNVRDWDAVINWVLVSDPKQ